MDPDRALFWPYSRIVEAVETLLVASGLPVTSNSIVRMPETGSVLIWLPRIPRSVGCDAHAGRVTRAELEENLEITTHPCLVGIPGPGGVDDWRCLTFFFESRWRVRVVGPERYERRMSRAELIDFVSGSFSSSGLETLFEGLPDGGRAVARLGDLSNSQAWFARFEPDASHPFWDRLRRTGALRPAVAYLALLLVQGVAALIAIWTLGSAAIDGHVDLGRIVAWTVLALTDIPLGYLAARSLGAFMIAVASSIKRRILEGTFRIDEREVRRQGYGELMARAHEANVLESTGFTEVFSAPIGLGQLLVACFLFEKTNYFQPFLASLLVTVVASALLGARVMRSQTDVYALRLGMTDDLVEKIIGHRTRAVQEIAAEHHGEEDFELATYLAACGRLDTARSVTTVFARIWVALAGSLLITFFMLRDSASSLAWAAVGILFAYRGFDGLMRALDAFGQWVPAYRGVRPLLEAGARRDRPPQRMQPETSVESRPTILSVSSLAFTYRSGGLPIINDGELRVRRGDRLLVEGPSGGGKTTLFKLIAGELRPTGGVILVNGGDVHSVSERDWLHRVASAPQFHENYVFAQPVAFNLDPLGGSDSASEEAMELCRELGLDQVISKMPQGYAQLLGETGWQLSHGEKSRLFIARALLQRAELLMFDENFSALDPETQLKVLECVRRRAHTLMVIAHT